MSKIERVFIGYLEAVLFTDVGEPCQPHPGWPLADGFLVASRLRCERAWAQYRDELTQARVEPEQFGRDLWFTTQGHGVGFWDRPQVYGEDLARELTAFSRRLGGLDSDFAIETPHTGSLVQCLRDETDTDEEGSERVTAAMSIGWLSRRDDANLQWSVEFPNGAAIWVTDEELASNDQYRFVPSEVPVFDHLSWREVSDDAAQAVTLTTVFHPEHAPEVGVHVTLRASLLGADDGDGQTAGAQVQCVVRMGSKTEAFPCELVGLAQDYEAGGGDLHELLKVNGADIMQRAFVELKQCVAASDRDVAIAAPRG